MYMSTLDKLCSYKDCADLVYKELHKLLLSEVNREFKILSKAEYYFDETDTTFVLLSDDPNDMPCFNWRKYQSLIGNPDIILHISFKKGIIVSTAFFLPPHLCMR